MFRANEGTLDRWLRLVFGSLLLASGLAVGDGAVAVSIVGVVVLATGVVGWCPLYSLLGLQTRPRR